MDRMVNILLTSFPGLGLPPTLSLPVPASTSIDDLESHIHRRLPVSLPPNTRLILTTTSNRQLVPSSTPVSHLLAHPDDALLPLRLSVPLCGGKGGFGSQLRAAGGRMSSRKKRNQGEDNGSNRNLDGRRLRTVNEAKALAEYLAIKPEMEKKDKEERRKRWEQVVELADRREAEIKTGAKAKVDGKWVEDRDEAADRTREAVLEMMQDGAYNHHKAATPSGSSGGGSAGASESSEEDEVKTAISNKKISSIPAIAIGKSAPTYFGWDEEDEYMSDSEEEDEADKAAEAVGTRDIAKDKGKAKA